MARAKGTPAGGEAAGGREPKKPRLTKETKVIVGNIAEQEAALKRLLERAQEFPKEAERVIRRRIEQIQEIIDDNRPTISGRAKSVEDRAQGLLATVIKGVKECENLIEQIRVEQEQLEADIALDDAEELLEMPPPPREVFEVPPVRAAQFKEIIDTLVRLNEIFEENNIKDHPTGAAIFKTLDSLAEVCSNTDLTNYKPADLKIFLRDLGQRLKGVKRRVDSVLEEKMQGSVAGDSASAVDTASSAPPAEPGPLTQRIELPNVAPAPQPPATGDTTPSAVAPPRRPKVKSAPRAPSAVPSPDQPPTPDTTTPGPKHLVDYKDTGQTYEAQIKRLVGDLLQEYQPLREAFIRGVEYKNKELRKKITEFKRDLEEIADTIINLKMLYRSDKASGVYHWQPRPRSDEYYQGKSDTPPETRAERERRFNLRKNDFRSIKSELTPNFTAADFDGMFEFCRQKLTALRAKLVAAEAPFERVVKKGRLKLSQAAPVFEGVDTYKALDWVEALKEFINSRLTAAEWQFYSGKLETLKRLARFFRKGGERKVAEFNKELGFFLEYLNSDNNRLNGQPLNLDEVAQMAEVEGAKHATARQEREARLRARGREFSPDDPSLELVDIGRAREIIAQLKANTLVIPNSDPERDLLRAGRKLPRHNESIRFFGTYWIKRSEGFTNREARNYCLAIKERLDRDRFPRQALNAELKPARNRGQMLSIIKSLEQFLQANFPTGPERPKYGSIQDRLQKLLGRLRVARRGDKRAEFNAAAKEILETANGFLLAGKRDPVDVPAIQANIDKLEADWAAGRAINGTTAKSDAPAGAAQVGSSAEGEPVSATAARSPDSGSAGSTDTVPEPAPAGESSQEESEEEGLFDDSDLDKLGLVKDVDGGDEDKPDQEKPVDLEDDEDDDERDELDFDELLAENDDAAPSNGATAPSAPAPRPKPATETARPPATTATKAEKGPAPTTIAPPAGESSADRKKRIKSERIAARDAARAETPGTPETATTATAAPSPAEAEPTTTAAAPAEAKTAPSPGVAGAPEKPTPAGAVEAATAAKPGATEVKPATATPEVGKPPTPAATPEAGKPAATATGAKAEAVPLAPETPATAPAETKEPKESGPRYQFVEGKVLEKGKVVLNLHIDGLPECANRHADGYDYYYYDKNHYLRLDADGNFEIKVGDEKIGPHPLKNEEHVVILLKYLQTATAKHLQGVELDFFATDKSEGASKKKSKKKARESAEDEGLAPTQSERQRGPWNWLRAKGKSIKDALFNKDVAKASVKVAYETVAGVTGLKLVGDLVGYGLGKLGKRIDLNVGFGDIYNRSENALQIKEEQKAIARAYDRLTEAWEDSWGEDRKNKDEAIKKRFNKLMSAVEDSKQMSPGDKQEFMSKLWAVAIEYQTGVLKSDFDRQERTRQVLDLYVQNKISATKIARDGLNFVLTATGFTMLRGLMYGGLSTVERGQKASVAYERDQIGRTKHETQVSRGNYIANDVAKAVAETGRAFFGRGERQGASGKQRAIDFVRSLGTIARGVGIYGLAWDAWNNGDAPKVAIDKLLASMEQSVLGTAWNNIDINAAKAWNLYSNIGHTAHHHLDSVFDRSPDVKSGSPILPGSGGIVSTGAARPSLADAGIARPTTADFGAARTSTGVDYNNFRGNKLLLAALDNMRSDISENRGVLDTLTAQRASNVAANLETALLHEKTTFGTAHLPKDIDSIATLDENGKLTILNNARFQSEILTPLKQHAVDIIHTEGDGAANLGRRDYDSYLKALNLDDAKASVHSTGDSLRAAGGGGRDSGGLAPADAGSSTRPAVPGELLYPWPEDAPPAKGVGPDDIPNPFDNGPTGKTPGAGDVPKSFNGKVVTGPLEETGSELQKARPAKGLDPNGFSNPFDNGPTGKTPGASDVPKPLDGNVVPELLEDAAKESAESHELPPRELAGTLERRYDDGVAIDMEYRLKFDDKGNVEVLLPRGSISNFNPHDHLKTGYATELIRQEDTTAFVDSDVKNLYITGRILQSLDTKSPAYNALLQIYAENVEQFKLKHGNILTTLPGYDLAEPTGGPIPTESLATGTEVEPPVRFGSVDIKFPEALPPPVANVAGKIIFRLNELADSSDKDSYAQEFKRLIESGVKQPTAYEELLKKLGSS